MQLTKPPAAAGAGRGSRGALRTLAQGQPGSSPLGSASGYALDRKSQARPGWILLQAAAIVCRPLIVGRSA
jgi:hypothetical protein